MCLRNPKQSNAFCLSPLLSWLFDRNNYNIIRHCIRTTRQLPNTHHITPNDSTNNDVCYSELIDTFFIVVHKKPLIFLHWYHHITVLLYCYHSYVTTSPPGIFFVVMNYSVHASMYGYYFLMAMKMRPKWFNPIVITIFQISQMIVGVAVTLAGFYYFKTDPTCGIEKENNTAAFVMYGSYLFLFLQFFFGRYYNKKMKKKVKSV